MTGSYDFILRNARILDGSGAAAREGDLAVRGDRIERLGEVGEGAATRELDLAGLAVAPGFIDVHTHDDFAAVLHSGMEFKTLGGVTTCVVGNCGMGAAPYREASLMARVFHPAHSLPRWGLTGRRRRHVQTQDLHPFRNGPLPEHGW